MTPSIAESNMTEHARTFSFEEAVFAHVYRND